ncbi:MAG: class I SAM-dependent methyltransferase, partial [Enterococcus sp.]
MKNIYDDNAFFESYSQMTRSQQGLTGAGEWQTLKALLPDFKGKRVLDLGCGYGWHCLYAAEHGATSVVGVDLSEKMLAVARQKNNFANVTYLHDSIDTVDFEAGSFDIVLSSLA